MKKLKLMELNAENLMINFERNYPEKKVVDLTEEEWQKLSSSNTPNKNLLKTIALSEAILDESPDVLAIVEVMGKYSLRLFNEYFLNNEYDVMYTFTNSSRGIDMGFLVKKGLEFSKEIKIYNSLKVSLSGNEIGKFSRGISELKLKNEKGNVEFIFLLAHLKSQISSDKDLNGFDQRRAEMQSFLDLYKQIEAENPESKIVLTGDFNGWAGKDKPDSEFSSIYSETELIDIHDVLNSSLEDRSSHVFFNFKKEAQNNQLDYIFLNKKSQEAMDKQNTYCYRYKYFGYPWPIAKSIEEKRQLPSDHYPQIVVLNYI